MPLTIPSTARAQIDCLTPVGIEQITGLHFQGVTDPSQIPAEPGVYLWAKDRNSPVYYHGRATGGRGLRGRLTNEMRWHREYREELGQHAGDLLGDDHLSSQVPMVRVCAEMGLSPFYAKATASRWYDKGQLYGPETAPEWEAFISEASRILTGHRSLLGGGAWESKPGTVSERMAEAARKRLLWMRAKDQADSATRLQSFRGRHLPQNLPEGATYPLEVGLDYEVGQLLDLEAVMTGLDGGGTTNISSVITPRGVDGWPLQHLLERAAFERGYRPLAVDELGNSAINMLARMARADQRMGRLIYRAHTDRATPPLSELVFLWRTDAPGYRAHWQIGWGPRGSVALMADLEAENGRPKGLRVTGVRELTEGIRWGYDPHR